MLEVVDVNLLCSLYLSSFGDKNCFESQYRSYDEHLEIVGCDIDSACLNPPQDIVVLSCFIRQVRTSKDMVFSVQNLHCEL